VTTMLPSGCTGSKAYGFPAPARQIIVASVLVLTLISLSATYWREGLDQLTDFVNFPLKATLIWLVCVSVTRGTFSVTLGRGLLKRRVLVLGNGTQRVVTHFEIWHSSHFEILRSSESPTGSNQSSPQRGMSERSRRLHPLFACITTRAFATTRAMPAWMRTPAQRGQTGRPCT